MSDRRLRERELAMEQRFALIERTQRDLRLRAYPGAARVTDPVEVVTPFNLDVPAVVASLTVTSGRWLITGQFDLYVPSPAGAVQVWQTIAFQDPESGAEITPTHVNVPRRRFYLTPTGTIIVPMTISGDFAHEDGNIVVQMLCQETSTTPETWQAYRPRLQLIPV